MLRQPLTTRLRATLFTSMLSAAALSVPATPVFAQQPQVPTDFTAIVKQKMPSVVAITTRQHVQEQSQMPSLPEDLPFREFFRRYYGDGAHQDQREQIRQALGSGFVISQDGYIVTNNHVVEGAEEIHVVFGENTNVPAKLVGHDQATDIAVLKVDPQPNMTVASWGDSDAAEPGSWAIAIGSPFGLGGTVTVGVVSARARDIRSGPYDDFIQTDASINRGNSGGPLFNAAGEVIGVNTAIFSPTGTNIGIGFAVPSRTAQAVANQLIQTGHIERGFIGLSLQDITPPIAQALGRPDDTGVLVASVEAGGPAEKAGAQSGDIITKFNDKPVENGRSLSRSVAAVKPGSEATLTVVRGGKTQDLKVTVGQRQEEQSTQMGSLDQQDTGKRLGLALSPIPDAARDQLGLKPGTTGVLVQRVEPNSPAAENGLKEGDVIVSANNQSVTSPSDVANAWSQAQQNKRPVLLRVKREDQYLFVAIGS
ncbi:DegQ family serine endoprotease [Microvirga sp. TS319]|uniref:DegQ family serine endoprotease n=1 Tax=Microvirga sp. TS319 TaxID=3241165 RepID=UPI00351A8786